MAWCQLIGLYSRHRRQPVPLSLLENGALAIGKSWGLSQQIQLQVLSHRIGTGLLEFGHPPRQGAGKRSARLARFSSRREVWGSMMLATHPANCSRPARSASALSKAWLMQPNRTPHHQNHRQLQGNMARSERFSRPDSGTRQPPAPSIKVKSAFCCQHLRIAASNVAPSASAPPPHAPPDAGQWPARRQTG